MVKHNCWKKYLLGITLVSSLPVAAYALNAPIIESTDAIPPINMPSESENGLGLDGVDWTMLLTKMGFSFLIGLSLGYALKISLKITLFVIGVLSLALFGLQYAGFIEINWHSLGSHYDSFLDWLLPRIGSFRDFVTSHLPSSSMAAMGLLIGFKMK